MDFRKKGKWVAGSWAGKAVGAQWGKRKVRTTSGDTIAASMRCQEKASDCLRRG